MQTKEQLAKWRAKYHANPIRALWHNRKYKYGITRDMCMEIIATQNFACPVCKESLIDIPENKWHIDHCHKTGVVRGVLCGPCNIQLGAIEKCRHIEAALKYLQKSSDYQI